MTSAPPEVLVLTSLQELLDAWTDERLDVAIEKCTFLLKKNIKLDSTLTRSVQRILLQCWLEKEEYSKTVTWIEQNSSNSQEMFSDLGHYAQYRMEEYDKITKNSSKESILEQHLLAQSYFHLKQTNAALKVYQEMLNNNDDDDDTTMELLSNALAVIASNGIVPYIPPVDDNHTKWIEKSQDFLLEHPEHCELAFNLGTLQVLTGDESQTNWLEEAEGNCEEKDDLINIETNIAWSHQFWSKDLEEVDYSAAQSSSLPASVIAGVNQSLLKEDSGSKIPSHPHPKWNALQLRMYWYNRAFLQYKADKLVECQESCQSLKRVVGGIESSSSSGKKKKKANDTKKSPADLWWGAKVDILLAHVQAKQSKATQAIEKLEQSVEFLKQQPSCYTIDHAIADILLHLTVLKYPSRKPTSEEAIDVLKSLPASIQLQPAVKATLAELGENQVSNKGKKSPTEQADIYFSQGNFTQAARLYDENLPNPPRSNELAQHLRHVQALASIGDHDRSTELWSSIQPFLDENFEPSSHHLDGESLEKQDLPRSSTTKAIDKQLDSANNDLSSSKAKRSQKSILRKRARKREAYLKELEAKGQYNPDRPTKPNPERWIPKHERSRNRRGGRRGGGINRSAQGGGSQADAERLDAFARRAGTAPTSAGPSTANLKVSNGGRRGGRRR